MGDALRLTSDGCRERWRHLWRPCLALAGARGPQPAAPRGHRSLRRMRGYIRKLASFLYWPCCNAAARSRVACAHPLRGVVRGHCCAMTRSCGTSPAHFRTARRSLQTPYKTQKCPVRGLQKKSCCINASHTVGLPSPVKACQTKSPFKGAAQSLSTSHLKHATCRAPALAPLLQPPLPSTAPATGAVRPSQLQPRVPSQRLSRAAEAALSQLSLA